MLFARAIMADRAGASGLDHLGRRDRATIPCLGEIGRNLEDAQRDARIAIGLCGEDFCGALLERQVPVPKASVGVAQGSLRKLYESPFVQWFQPEYPGSREKGGDDLERRILGGGANKNESAVFDVREKGILLGFVEAVDLVEE